MVKLELLRQLPQERLPKETRRFIAEGQRRFGAEDRGATISEARFIGSPMSVEAIGRASDADVINAFEKLPDSAGWTNPKDWEKGGNIQLARAFADYSKTDPARAVSLIAQLTSEIGTRASGYALDAMAEAADPALVLKTLADLDERGFEGEEFRGSAARAVERLIRRDIEIDEDTLERLIRWLTPPPVPESEQTDEDEDLFADVVSSVSGDVDKSDHVQSILWGLGGGSALPQGNFPILETLVRILLARGDSARAISTLEKHLDTDEEERVWAALVRFFRYFAPKDPKMLEAFLTKLYGKYPDLSHTRETALSLAYLQWKTPEFVRSMLETWKTLPRPRIQQALGEIAALVWLVQPQLTWTNSLIDHILQADTTDARTGAAFACVNVWPEADDTTRATDLLLRILARHEEEPWIAMVDLFRLVDEIEPTSDWARLLEAVADEIPRHKKMQSTFAVERLQSLLPHKASLVAKIALALTKKWRDELADMRTGTSSAAPDLVDIAITLHRLSPDTREAGEKLFEELLYLNAYTARETLNQIDNRFPELGVRPRKRLPRRSQNARPRRPASKAAA